MGYGIDKKVNEVKVKDVVEIPYIVDIEENNREGVSGTTQRP